MGVTTIILDFTYSDTKTIGFKQPMRISGSMIDFQRFGTETNGFTNVWYIIIQSWLHVSGMEIYLLHICQNVSILLHFKAV